jgi:hypothetical protein
VRCVVMRGVSVLLRARMRRNIVRGLRDDRGWLCVVEAPFAMLFCFALMWRRRSFHDFRHQAYSPNAKPNFWFYLLAFFFPRGMRRQGQQKGCVTSGWPFCNTYSLLLLSDAPSPLSCRPVLGATLDLLMHPDFESRPALRWKRKGEERKCLGERQ